MPARRSQATHALAPLVIAGAGLLFLTPAALAQATGEWDGGEAFGRLTLKQTGPSLGGNFTFQNGRVWGPFQNGTFDGLWSQESSSQRCSQPAADGRYYWGHVLLKFTGNTFYGGWGHCEEPARLDGSAAGTRIPVSTSVPQAPAAPPRPLVPLASPQDADCGDFHLKLSPGWALPAATAKGNWIVTYAKSLKNGPASPVTPLQMTPYGRSMTYADDSERHAAVEEFRTALWRGKLPVEQADTMKVAGVKVDRFMQKGNTGWRFYLFPYNNVKVYGLYVFSPGDKRELPPEATQLLATLKLPQVKLPPKPAPPKPEKAPKDYLKNVGSGLNFFSPDDERELGMDASNQMNQQLSLLDDPAIQSYIESLGQRLVAASRNPQLECRFFVVNTREVNAFALPGCFVYVNRALIDLAQSEGQLAGVMAHEIGHVVGRHAAKQISKQLLLLGLVEGVSEAVCEKSRKWADLIATVGGFGAMLAKLKYSRDDEHQADALGVETMAAAGYDPHDLVDFFQLMEPGSKLDTSGRIMGILSTHPVTADREKVLSWQAAHTTYSGAAESGGAVAFQNCRTELARWSMPPPDGDVTLANALAATGLSGDSGK